MNIISKIGAIMAKNRASVKAILDKYNIPSGGSDADRIRAAFTSIKSGNTDLAAELSAVSSIGGAKTKVSPAKAQKIIGQIKAGLNEIKAKLAARKSGKSTSNGQPVPVTVNPTYSYPDPKITGKDAGNMQQIISGVSSIIHDDSSDNSALNIPSATPQSFYADGASDTISQDSAALVDALSSSDIESSVQEASVSAKAADLSDTRTLMGLSIVFIVIIVALFNPWKLLNSK